MEIVVQHLINVHNFHLNKDLYVHNKMFLVMVLEQVSVKVFHYYLNAMLME